MKSNTLTRLSQISQLLLEVLGTSGLRLHPQTAESSLRAYLQVLNLELSATYSEAEKELISTGSVELDSEGIKATAAAAEDSILAIRKANRMAAVSHALYEVVYPSLQDAFAKAHLNFRLGLLFATSRFPSPYLNHENGSATSVPPDLNQIARGWTQLESFQQLAARWQGPVVEKSLAWACEHLEPATGALAFLEKQQQLTNEQLLLVGQYWLLTSEQEKARKLAQAQARVPALTALIYLLDGRYEQAREAFAQAVEREEHRQLTLPLTRLGYVLSLLREESLETALRQCGSETRGADPWMRWLCDQRQGRSTQPKPEPCNGRMTLSEWLSASTSALALQDAELQDNLRESAESLLERAREHGFQWAHQQMLQILQKFEHPQELIPPWDCLKPEKPWKRRLSKLLKLAQTPQESSQERICWIVSGNAAGQWEATPRLQTRAKGGSWNKGKAIDARKTVPACADEADKRVLRLSATNDYTTPRILAALVGHPRVFQEGNQQRLEILEGIPEFRVQQTPGGLTLTLEPPCPGQSGVVVASEGQSQLRVFHFDPMLQSLSEIVGTGITLPSGEEANVRKLLAQLPSSVQISSDLASDEVQEIASQEGLTMRVRPLGEGLEISLLVRPLGHEGPEYPPGLGGERLLVMRHGERTQAVRNLLRERELSQSVFQLCPALVQPCPTMIWSFPDVRSSLEALEQIGQLPSDLVTLEWPEGKSLKIRQKVSEENLQVRAQGQGDWLKLEGELKLDNGDIWRLEELLERFRHSNGRFIALEAGEFLALTEDFRRRLEELSRSLEEQDGELNLHPLAAGVLEHLEVDGDDAFRQRLLRMNTSQDLKLEVPTTFRADLRSYQREGFQWLAQRAHWGVGACLADDMGLGKTLQALSLLVQRAPQGPALVVAPTSLSGNWMDEAHRFAPTLRLQCLNEVNRKSAVDNAEAFDVILVSYGILARETELLASRTWSTLVLDEAQAIKNHSTQRFQSVLKLKSDFRFATTGTPMENRLEELWALFQFLNPGLLGNIENFRRRFVTPIETGDENCRAQLKALVLPFLLRRTKSQVLTELPPKTEVRMEVELSHSERTFYEALRGSALEKLGNSEAEAVAVLAELTRLRRACCHPGLVDPEYLSDSSSKLEAVRELLDDLREGGHRTLIFSQFVAHLQLLRKQLEEQGISYQYLDGSTPAQERTRRVRAFQSGEGEVFLISLKAGGFGLNLTAADYVIHMDPWWNPAVEDQASDRAHRMGQQRPVTVYRMVAKNTVEEKILALHASKRELVDGLLEGAEQPLRLSASELLNLMLQ